MTPRQTADALIATIGREPPYYAIHPIGVAVLEWHCRTVADRRVTVLVGERSMTAIRHWYDAEDVARDSEHDVGGAEDVREHLRWMDDTPAPVEAP
jgi:hypothetical protein